MFCALIMAGGKGTRFWPLSTEEKPKQFLNLLGKETMIQMTVNRLRKVMPIEQIFVATGEQYKELVKEQISDLPEKNIIIEPVGRNTAPCIALSAFVINTLYKDAVIAVVPSDHLIMDEVKFDNTLLAASKFVEENEDSIVTLGIRPNRPETGYGYIKYDDTSYEKDGFQIKRVDSFVEKPNLEKAKLYIEDGKYLWNGGMFIWKTSTILKLTEKYMENTYNLLNSIFLETDIFSHEYNKLLFERYNFVENISVDYAIMEKVKNMYVIPSEFGWDDIGTWEAIERYREKDSNNNIISGDIKTINSQENIVISNNKPIILVGLENIFCVETDELIFVGKREDISRVKEIKDKL